MLARSHVLASDGGVLRLYQDLAAIHRGSTTTDEFELDPPPHIVPFMVEKMHHMWVDEQRRVLDNQPPGYFL